MRSRSISRRLAEIERRRGITNVPTQLIIYYENEFLFSTEPCECHIALGNGREWHRGENESMQAFENRVKTELDLKPGKNILTFYPAGLSTLHW